MCICEKPSQCSSRSARAPRFFTASSRARATFSRSKARARDGPGSPSPPRLPSSFVARDDGFLLDAFPRRARRRGVGVRLRARRERVVPRREGQLQRPHARLDQGDVRDVHRELRHAALRCHPRVRPPATSRLFSARRAPRSRPDARPLRTTRSDDLFFLSRSRAPIERLPALAHPRAPLPPRSGTLAYPPSDKDACDPFGVRARRAPSSLSRRFPRAVVRSEEVLSFFRLLLRRRA